MRFWRKNNGFTSIYAIIWMVVLFPLLMFAFIDGSHYISKVIELKKVTDNAANAAVLQLNQAVIPQGVLEIDTDQATLTAKTILQDALNLDNTLKTKPDDVNFYGDPIITIDIVNDVPLTGLSYPTPLTAVQLQNPSVVIYAEYPIKGLFFYNEHVTIKKIGVAQVQFRR